MNCRACNETRFTDLVDLGLSPISNRFLTAEDLFHDEPSWPLRVKICRNCRLAQLDDFETRENLFNDEYAYFSSYSTSWLQHAKQFVDDIVPRLNLNQSSKVVEIASNDGYLLRNFVERGIGCLGVEPCSNVAQAAIDIGVPTEVCFFEAETSESIRDSFGSADLIIANNVLAHVPNLHTFVEGFRTLLKDDGIACFEFPHLLELIRHTQFDTIYHEHYSYLSLIAIKPLFLDKGLMLVDVQKLKTHGGSLRLFVGHQGKHEESQNVEKLMAEELNAGLNSDEGYAGFQNKVNVIRDRLTEMLCEAKKQSRLVVGYGAAAKGNTLLNYCGITTELVEWIADRSPRKQGCFTPGTHIPIVAPEKIKECSPDDVLLLPWNLKHEISKQLKLLTTGKPTRMIVPIPYPEFIAL